MAEGTNLSISIKQTVGISQSMLQYLSLLQMDVAALENHIDRMSMENPVIEIVYAPDTKNRLSVLRTSSAKSRAQQSGSVDGSALDTLTAQDEFDTLEMFLRDQLSRKRLPNELFSLCEQMIHFLDEDGYLPEALWQQVLCRSGNPEPLLRQALDELQKLDPAGVAARSLSECLVLQLSRRGGNTRFAAAIASDHLEDLAQKRFPRIAKKLGCTVADVRAAAAVIERLDPKPGLAFCLAEAPVYIQPDIVVAADSRGRIDVAFSNGVFPDIRINSDYREMLSQSEDGEVRGYLKEKISEAARLKSCLEQRRQTLEACVSAVVHLQCAFFRDRSAPLKPMTLCDISAATGLHVSTVSRALKDKYLQCERGTFPLQFFCSKRIRTLAGEDSSAHHAKTLLTELVAKENKSAPLSDQKLQEALNARGLMISRRTVAKYRDELNIPSTRVRRIS